uniref:Uncharacterized protein n=1 Tax=Florenciella sp. virus SA2 TaxID=3240092 RepID=A0AB39JCU8_9VIRU
MSLSLSCKSHSEGDVVLKRPNINTNKIHSFIGDSINYYDNNKCPTTPRMRRTSRNFKTEREYILHDRLLNFYKLRGQEIAEVHNIVVNQKKRYNMIKKMMISNFGYNFGELFTNKIFQEYLKSKKNRPNYYCKNTDLPLLPPKLSCSYIVNDLQNKYYYKYRDPRVSEYSAMELVPYLQGGYDILSNGGQKYILISSCKFEIPDPENENE